MLNHFMITVGKEKQYIQLQYVYIYIFFFKKKLKKKKKNKEKKACEPHLHIWHFLQSSAIFKVQIFLKYPRKMPWMWVKMVSFTLLLFHQFI